VPLQRVGLSYALVSIRADCQIQIWEDRTPIKRPRLAAFDVTDHS
jgi:hypothetical protein